MGTTATTEFAPSKSVELSPARARVPSRLALSALSGLLGAAFLAASGAARAQVWNVGVSGEAVLSVSDNPFFQPPGQEQQDTSLALRPRITVSRFGPRLRASGEFGVDLVGHSSDAERNRASPLVRGSLSSEMIERWLFLDASVDVSRRDADAFAPRGSEVSNFNRRLVSAYRLRPRIEHQFGSAFSLRATSDWSWLRMPEDTDNGVATLERRSQRAHREEVVLERTPKPFGMSLELTDEESQLAGAPDQQLSQSSIKVGASYVIEPDARVGVFAGRERSRFLLSEDTDTIYGLRFRWAPGPRTTLDSEVSKRYFGTGLEFGFAHRMPWLSTSVRLRRGPAASPLSIQQAGSRNDLANYLDAILTTRYPDAVERGQLVQDILANRGLPQDLVGAVALLGRYAQLEQGGNATVVLFGQRNTFTLSAYSMTYRQLRRDSDSIAAGTVLDNDNRQRGASFGFNRRLTPVTAMDITLRYLRADGLAAREGNRTTQQDYGLNFTRALSPRTTATLGALRRSAKTSVGDQQQTRKELSAFVGLKHRF